MSAPAIEVYAPDAIFAGEACDIEIEVAAREDARVTGIHAELRCHRGWNLSSLYQFAGAPAHELLAPDLRTRLVGPGVIAAGTTRHPISLPMPDDVPPSHDHGIAWSRVELRVVVGTRWWPDRERRFPIQVRRRPQLPVERTPVSLDGASGIALALASTRLVAGETMTGTLRWFGPIELAFVPVFRLKRDGFATEQLGRPIIRVIAPGEFRVQLPADMTPSFASSTHELAWRLVARGGDPGTTLATQLDIVDATAITATRRLAIAPTLADEAIAHALARIAGERGWRIGDEPSGGVLIGPDASATVGTAYRGGRMYLVARFAYPPLGLALDGEDGRAVRARDDAQAAPVVRAVVPALTEARALGGLVRWTDRELVLERLAFSIHELPRIADALARVSSIVAEARKLVAPPAGIDVEPWHALAESYGGTLAIGDLSLWGASRGIPVRLALRFDGARPIGVDVSVGAVTDDDGEPVEAPELPAGTLDFKLARGVVSACCPAIDPAAVRMLVDALRAIVLARQTGAGPYR